MRLGMTIVTLAVVGLVAGQPADARGRHHGGSGGQHGMADESGEASRGGNFAGDQRRANDDYVKAAAKEEDKLLDSKIKSICRGC